MYRWEQPKVNGISFVSLSATGYKQPKLALTRAQTRCILDYETSTRVSYNPTWQTNPLSLVDNRGSAGLNRSIISPFLLSLFPLMGKIKVHPHDSASPVAPTGQYPWLTVEWMDLPVRMGYCLNTNWAQLFLLRWKKRWLYARAAFVQMCATGGVRRLSWANNLFVLCMSDRERPVSCDICDM